MGSNEKCSRQHCSHQRVDHRAAPSERGVLVGACQVLHCKCAQYVFEGLRADNRVLDMYGDGGFSQRTTLTPGEKQRSSATRVVVYERV